MKKRILSLLLAAAMLVLLAVPAFAEDEHAIPMWPWVTASPPVWA